MRLAPGSAGQGRFTAECHAHGLPSMSSHANGCHSCNARDHFAELIRSPAQLRCALPHLCHTLPRTAGAPASSPPA